MSSFFSKIKNWQLFLLLIFPYIIFYYTTSIGTGLSKFIFSIFLLFLPFLILTFWYISIGNFLGRVSNEKNKTNYFNINFILIIAFTIFVYSYAYLQSGDTFSTNITIVSTNENDNPLFTGLIAPIMTIVTLYMVFAIFYNMYFIGNCISIINKRNEALKVLFQIWFFPIGIWFLQPKINKIYSSVKNKA